MIHIRLPIIIRRKLKALAAVENKSITQLLGEVIADYLEDKKVSID